MTKKEKAKERITEVVTGVAASTLLVLSAFTFARVCLAPCPAFSAPADVATADTQWGDVVPTNSIGSVMASAGIATVEYVDRVAAEVLVSIKNDFAKNFTPLAAPIITNVVEDILTPRTVDWYCDSTNQTAAATTLTVVTIPEAVHAEEPQIEVDPVAPAQHLDAHPDWYNRIEAETGSRAYWILYTAREKARCGENTDALASAFVQTLARWMAQ